MKIVAATLSRIRGIDVRSIKESSPNDVGRRIVGPKLPPAGNGLKSLTGSN
jgi:hypothetical protein